MAQGLLSYDRIDEFIPANTIAASRPGQWLGLDLAFQQHRAWDGEVPPLRDYLVTCFTRPGRVRRKMTDRWQIEEFQTGDVTLVPRGQAALWSWEETFQNIHLSISHMFMRNIARRVFDHDVAEIDFVDQLRIGDPLIAFNLRTLLAEIQEGGAAEHLLVDAAATQTCVRILRSYSIAALAKPAVAGRLNRAKASALEDYISANLASVLSIEELSNVAEMSPYHFARRFKLHFGQTPHQFVVTRRLERANILIKQGHMALKQVSALCGFYDQSHMTRLFRQHFGTTPMTMMQDLDLPRPVPVLIEPERVGVNPKKQRSR